jgi:hypothetical protein
MVIIQKFFLGKLNNKKKYKKNQIIFELKNLYCLSMNSFTIKSNINFYKYSKKNEFLLF